MRMTGIRVLSGPNLYDDSGGVVIGTELASLPPAGEPLPLSRHRIDRIFVALAIPGLADQWAATAARGRTALPALLVRLATDLVTTASIFPASGQVIDASGSRLAVFIGCEHETIGATAWECACKTVMACLDEGRVAAFEAVLAAFRSAAQQYAADITTAALAREARRLDLPWYRLKIPGQLIQIGQGTHRRFLFDSTSDATGAISRLMAQDKQLTNRLLRVAGVPVLAMAEVTNEAAAIAAAERIGYPVVVKPCHGGQGRGVSVHLTSAAEVAAAFKLATTPPDSVIVEKFATGDDYRVLVVDGRVASVARRLPAHVVGDGQRSIAALIDRLNQDPRRGHDHDKLLVLVEVDDAMVALLAEQGLTPESIPAEGRHVGLRRTANISTGGTALDATAALHPDNKAILERAAASMRLSIAGIDFLSDDIARSWREVSGVVLELNPFPGLRPNWLAHAEHGVNEPILRALLPPGSDGRIPTCAITGSVGKTTTANMVARILAAGGLTVGRCTSTGVTVGDERRRGGDCAGGRHARELLLDRSVEAGVFELARGGLLKHGMTIEGIDVAAVLNVLDNHIGSDGIASRADLARIKSVVARRARKTLVLNAEDPLCLAMRQGATAPHVCLVGRNAGTPALRAHVEAGGAAVMLRPSADGDLMVLVERGIAEPLMATAAIPATLGGRHVGKVWNALFAAAIAQAMGSSLDHVRQGLRSFKPDMADSEGRLSIIDGPAFTVIVDPIDGPESAGALAQVARQIAVPGRKRLLVNASGERPDGFIRATGRALAGAFDRYVCTNWTKASRPDPQTAPGLLRDGLLAGGVADPAIVLIPSEKDALHQILREAEAGDLVVLTSDAPEALAAIDSLRPVAGPDRREDLPRRAVL